MHHLGGTAKPRAPRRRGRRTATGYAAGEPRTPAAPARPPAFAPIFPASDGPRAASRERNWGGPSKPRAAIPITIRSAKFTTHSPHPTVQPLLTGRRVRVDATGAASGPRGRDLPSVHRHLAIHQTILNLQRSLDQPAHKPLPRDTPSSRVHPLPQLIRQPHHQHACKCMQKHAFAGAGPSFTSPATRPGPANDCRNPTRRRSSTRATRGTPKPKHAIPGRLARARV